MVTPTISAAVRVTTLSIKIVNAGVKDTDGSSAVDLQVVATYSDARTTASEIHRLKSGDSYLLNAEDHVLTRKHPEPEPHEDVAVQCCNCKSKCEDCGNLLRNGHMTTCALYVAPIPKSNGEAGAVNWRKLFHHFVPASHSEPARCGHRWNDEISRMPGARQVCGRPADQVNHIDYILSHPDLPWGPTDDYLRRAALSMLAELHPGGICRCLSRAPAASIQEHQPTNA